jgi:hypothetical protein
MKCRNMIRAKRAGLTELEYWDLKQQKAKRSTK